MRIKGKKVRLTLDLTWKLCLRMWGDIKDCGAWNSRQAKDKWMAAAKITDVVYNCFFCEYAGRREDEYDGCDKCPAKKVEDKFLCEDDDYNYEYSPDKFYAKLLELNKKRKKK